MKTDQKVTKRTSLYLNGFSELLSTCTQHDIAKETVVNWCHSNDVYTVMYGAYRIKFANLTFVKNLPSKIRTNKFHLLNNLHSKQTNLVQVME